MLYGNHIRDLIRRRTGLSRFQGITYGLWAKGWYTDTWRGQEFYTETIYTLLDVKMKNKKHYIIVTILPLVFLISIVIFKIQENAILQLIIMFTTLMFLVLLITNILWLIRQWKSEKWLSLYPIVLWIIILLTTPAITFFCVKKLFEYNLPKFQEIVEELKKEQYEPGERKRSDKNVGQLVDSWYEDEVFIAQIWWGSGFPVKHTCYVYVSSGDIEKIEYFTKSFYGRIRLNQHWFRVFD